VACLPGTFRAWGDEGLNHPWTGIAGEARRDTGYNVADASNPDDNVSSPRDFLAPGQPIPLSLVPHHTSLAIRAERFSSVIVYDKACLLLAFEIFSLLKVFSSTA
jgi:hypothetical protein